MSTWHLDQELADRYTDGRVGGALASSVEQHLISCATCRSLLRADESRVDAVWAEVLDRVEAPREGWLERVLRLVRVSAPTARLVAATPTLRGAWLTGVVVLLALAVFASHASPRGTAVFVALAPVLPLAGVALSFGDRTDPTLEIAAASPYSLFRLLAVRTAFVAATTLVPAAVVSQLLPGDRWLTVGWLLPALAMCAVVLAGANRLEPRLTALALSLGWVAVTTWRMLAGRPLLVEHGAVVQALSLVVLLVAAGHLLTHRNDLSRRVA